MLGSQNRAVGIVDVFEEVLIWVVEKRSRIYNQQRNNTIEVIFTMSDPKYSTLIKILDSIRKQAPDSTKFDGFRSTQPDDIQYYRGQAFIHLFLLVKFGIETFLDRLQFICDGEQDGGLDAYYISETQKTVYLIQSKFKNSDVGFVTESISVSDLVRMELDRILQGQSNHSNGIVYNPKVLEFQLNYNRATKKQVYTPKVVFLANLRDHNDYQIRKLTNNLDYEVYDFERSYLELAKPICSGTYYDPERIVIELDIAEKSAPQLNQTIGTTYGSCDVTAVFVPTGEIGKVMSRYKNAILRYNPRNYLGLSKNPVNKEIRKSILDFTENDFALLNNGITILADEQEFTIYTGAKNVGRLTLTNPQIINGGQTAYTLSEIYGGEYKTNPSIFQGKEVLVRVVVLKPNPGDPAENKFRFIESISISTNQQTQVKEADRNSSNPLLVDVQRRIFLKYGYLLGLKKGEFYDGLSKGFVDRAFVIERTGLLRSFVAFKGQPASARSQSEPKLYDKAFFDNVFSATVISNIDKLVSEMFYAHSVHRFLVSREKGVGRKSLRHGYSLRYGKYAVVYASSILLHTNFRKNLHKRSLDEIEQYIANNIPITLDKWKKFEDYIQELPSNKSYFDPSHHLTDFDSYYKGPNLGADIKNYFKAAGH